MRIIALACPMLLFTGCAAERNRMDAVVTHSYSLEFRELDGILCMPLWVPTSNPKSRELYHHPVLGIRIDGVEADGISVEERDHNVDYDDFDMGTMQAQYRWHGYQVLLWSTDDEKAFEFVSASRVEEDDFDLKEYLIPLNVTRLVVRYRPRYPLDELGDPIVAVAERNDLSP